MHLYVSIPSWRDQDFVEPLMKKCEVTFNEREEHPSRDVLKKLVKMYDGMIIGSRDIIDGEVLDKANLKFIAVLAKGIDNVDIEAARKKEIAVLHTPEANTTSVAEHVMALILALAKNIVNLDKSVRHEVFDLMRGSTRDIREKHLGVIGAGPIAEETIRLAKSFCMDVTCYTRHSENHRDLEVDFVVFNYLLSVSDFVSISLPLTEETHHMIGETEFSLMKPTAYLINTARGGIVDESALIKALKEKQIAGAALDVFEEEPVHDKELFGLNNVILTPHVAGISKEALQRMRTHLIDDIISLIDGGRPKYRVV
jgi:lactate dehydrogenase-like 2-hydroxyacid dehydrogenase